jgi:hypothetical protein
MWPVLLRGKIMFGSIFQKASKCDGYFGSGGEEKDEISRVKTL